jgi:uncharacterized protein YndB with AHSA1/START domain
LFPALKFVCGGNFYFANVVITPHNVVFTQHKHVILTLFLYHQNSKYFKLKKLTKMETTTATTPITVQTTVNAPVAKVWESWSEPKHITQWCAASNDWHAPKAENDLREGGSFSTTMAAKDGSFSFDFGGIYDVVKPNEYIEYTLGDDRKVKISFTGTGDTTTVTETFDPETQNPAEMQRGGWQAIIDNFKKYTETL